MLVVCILVFFGVGTGFAVLAYQNTFVAKASLVKDEKINPPDTVEVNFSQPMLTESVKKGIKIEPSAEVEFSWSNKNRHLLIKPKKGWLPNTTYKISIQNAMSAYFTNVSLELSFKSVAYPSIKAFSPLEGEKDVALDMENPITADFKNLTKGWDIKFVIDPANDLAFSRDDEKHQIRLMPRKDLENGKKYSVKIFAKYSTQISQEYKQIYETSFETKMPLPPEKWDKDPQIRLQQAKENTKAQVVSGKYIDINLTKQVMVIFENSKALDSYLVSSGKRGMETPVGSYAIHNKSPRAWSKKYGLWMPNWMAFLPSGEMGIHELPVWPGGYQEGANHLGTPVSHGCVRLGSTAAKRVYDWAEIGTPVIIHS